MMVSGTDTTRPDFTSAPSATQARPALTMVAIKQAK